MRRLGVHMPSMRASGLTFAWILFIGGAAFVQAQQPSPYTPEVMEELRRVVPGGGKLTEDQINRRMLESKPATGAPKPSLPGPTKPLEEKQARAEALRLQGAELSRLHVRLPQDGTRAGPAARAISGSVAVIEPQRIVLRSGDGKDFTFDYSWTSGIDLSILSRPKATVVAKWGYASNPGGMVHGLALREGEQLWFASESRRVQRILNDADVRPFALRQVEQGNKEPAMATECLRIYFLDVQLKAEKETYIIPHGHRRLISASGGTYLVEIIRSARTVGLPCGTAIEALPWELEYVIWRVDDPKVLARLRSALEKQEAPTGKYKPDAPNSKLKADGQPNPKLRGDGPPDTSKKLDEAPPRAAR